MAKKNMNTTKIILFILCLTVSIIFAGNMAGAADPVSQTGPVKFVAYYFHGTHRCNTCRTIEQYSREAIESFFAKELKEGTLEFKPVNIDEPANRHFIKDFQLVTRSLVITRYEGTEVKKYKNLDEVWTRVGNKLKFYQYVKNELEQFFKENP